MLDRLVLATQLRFPVVGDLARSVRFRWFDQPVVEAERGPTCSPACATSSPTWPPTRTRADHAARIEALAAIPEQIVRFLAERLEQGVPEREPMLEVLARRHYREHELHDLRTLTVGRPPVRRLRLHARRPADPPGDDASAPWPSWPSPADRRPGRQRSAAQVAAAPAGHEAVVDLYLHWPDAPDVADEASARLRGCWSAACRSPSDVRRVAVAVCPGGDRPVAYFTFRPGDRTASSRTTWSAACTRWSAAG